ncbi:MAG: hypothetical protein PUG53_07510, partial [Eubacterium sp.]|nr:hypothetical protein [Eubacterium sp.]
YFMSLYGDSYTVKGYALVNLDDKTVVGTGLLDVEKSDAGALNAAVENYIAALKAKNIVDASADADDYKVDSDEDTIIDENGEDAAKLNTVSGEITDIMTSVNDGNTVYYLQINGKYYYIAVTDCMDVLLMKKGDTVTVTFDKDSDTFVQAKSIKK